MQKTDKQADIFLMKEIHFIIYYKFNELLFSIRDIQFTRGAYIFIISLYKILDVYTDILSLILDTYDSVNSDTIVVVPLFTNTQCPDVIEIAAWARFCVNTAFIAGH